MQNQKIPSNSDIREIENEMGIDSDKSKAEKALSERPSISIRLRLSLAFALVFALCGCITLWIILSLYEMEDKIHFLFTADNYLSEIQQARRFEKNFLLYGTNLDDALEHLRIAEQILTRDRNTIEKIVGKALINTIIQHVGNYHQSLTKLIKTNTEAEKNRIENELRKHGSQMVSLASDFVQKERDTVDRRLSLTRKIAFYFLGVLFIVLIIVVNFFLQQILQTLNRFMEYTKRIGDGDFSPIMPKRKYKDEFSNLAIAFNHMIHELNRRHRILLESHKLRAIGTLTAGVAHELNNPLNNIMLTAASIEEDYQDFSDEEKLEMMQDILSESERAQKIVHNLLDFSRETETAMKPIELNMIVQKSIKLVSNQIKKFSRVYLETNFEKDLPPVHGDPQMLKQVFINLMLNAADASPKKGKIEISVRKAQEEGFIAVIVQDHGPGIPEHILHRIFDPFFTTKTGNKGTGLGLSVSQGIIQKSGGIIKVNSQVGQGTVFTVLLPITHVPSQISSGSK